MIFRTILLLVLLFQLLKPTLSLATPTAATQHLTALAPGSVVQVQVGDVTLGRKAWKKRRRNESPLLVPCSVLHVDHVQALRWNAIYLLEKFGNRQGSQSIYLSIPQLRQRFRSHLKSSLTAHADSLGYGDDVDALVTRELFPTSVQDTFGVRVGTVLDNDMDRLALLAPISKFKAQRRAAGVALAQFEGPSDDVLLHTGTVRLRRDEEGDDKNIYSLKALSAALRVNQEDVDEGRVHDGSTHAAVVFDFDALGDGGNPLLTLSLNPARNNVQERLRITSPNKIIKDFTLLSDLKAGAGPLEGKIIRLVKGGALVDCNIGRQSKQAGQGEAVQVLGLLKFRDAVVPVDYGVVTSEMDEQDSDDIDHSGDLDELFVFDDEDEEDDEEPDLGAALDLTALDNDPEFSDAEDITHMFHLDGDGNLLYSDPEQGGDDVIVLSNDDAELSATSSQPSNGFVASKTPSTISRHDSHAGTKTRKLQVGEKVAVYVKKILKQSNRISFTMNSVVPKAKDVKKRTHKSKKLSRLAKQIGGLARANELKGRQMAGRIKAASNTGEWFYVEPQEEGLPVGVAMLDSDDLSDIVEGDMVRIELKGIDQERGQLAMSIVGRL